MLDRVLNTPSYQNIFQKAALFTWTIPIKINVQPCFGIRHENKIIRLIALKFQEPTLL